MTAEMIELERERVDYPLSFDMPLKSVWFVHSGVNYMIPFISPADMIAARRGRQNTGDAVYGHPLYASVMHPKTLDIFPWPSEALPLYIEYDDAEAWRQQKERDRSHWIAEYERYHAR